MTTPLTDDELDRITSGQQLLADALRVLPSRPGLRRVRQDIQALMYGLVDLISDSRKITVRVTIDRETEGLDALCPFTSLNPDVVIVQDSDFDLCGLATDNHDRGEC